MREACAAGLAAAEGLHSISSSIDALLQTGAEHVHLLPMEAYTALAYRCMQRIHGGGAAGKNTAAMAR